MEKAPMTLTVRPIRAADVPAAGRICYEAFAAIANEHNFPPDFPDIDVATALLGRLITHPGVYGVVAELDGEIVGSNFVDERSAIVGLGPITVDPSAQNRGAGAALMSHVIERAERNNAPGLRLIQAGYHRRSLCLYAKLGFTVREPLVNLQGSPPGVVVPGCAVRAAVIDNAAAADRLCREAHGHDRGRDFRDAIEQGTAAVVERDGHLTTTQIAFFGHAIAKTDEDLKALIAAAPSFAGPGFLLPCRNTELFRWCLEQGLRVVQPMTLMTIGLYNEPRGAYLPSILY
jgi:GNAT superfamily N-acetyltransferase